MNMYRHTFEAMDDLCNGVLIDFPSVVPGYYREIREENSGAHVASFEFAEEFCTDDPMRGDSIAVKGKFTRNETNEDDTSCFKRFRDNITACSECENEIQSRALESPRWLWGQHFHRAYRWFKNAPFAVNATIFRDELSKALRVLNLDSDSRLKRTPRRRQDTTSCITSGFRSGENEYRPPVLRNGYMGPQRDVAIACCNLPPSWVRKTWLRVMSDDDVSSCGHRIGLSDKIGSFEPMSLEHAKRVCDADEICVAFAYTALGALFKSARQPIVPFSELAMYVVFDT